LSKNYKEDQERTNAVGLHDDSVQITEESI
jgi:hypothetical protein